MDFESRRQRILDKMEDNSIAILYSGIEHHVSADEYDLFTAQANRNFFYLTGLRRDNMVLVLDKCVEPAKTILFIEEADPTMERWYGRKVTMEEAEEISGIDEVEYIYELESTLDRIMTREDVYTAYFDTYRHQKVDLPDYNVVKANEFKTDYPGVAVKNLFPLVAEERMQKDEDEIELTKKAIITNGRFDLFHPVAGVPCQQAGQFSLGGQNGFCRFLDGGCTATYPARSGSDLRFMDHDHAVPQDKAVAASATGQNHRRHAGRQLHTVQVDGHSHALQLVVKGKARLHGAAGRGDDKLDGGCGICAFQKQKLLDDGVDRAGVDLTGQEHRPLRQKHGIQRKALGAAAAFLDHLHGNSLLCFFWFQYTSSAVQCVSPSSLQPQVLHFRCADQLRIPTQQFQDFLLRVWLFRIDVLLGIDAERTFPCGFHPHSGPVPRRVTAFHAAVFLPPGAIYQPPALQRAV